MGRAAVRRRASDAGFSLVEAAVVCLVLLILAVIGVSVYLNQRDKAYRTSAVNAIRNITTVANAGYEGVYPPAASLAAEVSVYTFVPADRPSTGETVVSLELVDGGQSLTMAVRGGPHCYYQRVSEGGTNTFRHLADIADGPRCSAEEFRTGEGDGW